MISHEFAESFAEEWLEAWNAHDLDRIMSHYAPDFVFASPLIPAVAGEASGVLKGHDAMRAYWSKALQRRPDLKFKRKNLLVGVNSLVIYYKRHDGRRGAEHFEFGPDRKVIRSAAHYDA